MPITITQPGEAAAAAKVGTIIGKGKRAEEDRARAEREAARAQQIAAQQSARQAAMEWEQQKMLLNSQQDFAHEMRMRQAGLDKEARAEEWQVEKMELASKIDFEQDEKERIRRKAEYTAGRDSINDNENLTDTQKADANFRLSVGFVKDVPEAAAGLGLKPPSQIRARTHRDKLLDIAGSYYEDESLPDIEAAVIEAGYDPETYEEFDLASEDLREIGLDPQDFLGIGGDIEQPTAEELRALGTKEAYEKGKALGYWL